MSSGTPLRKKSPQKKRKNKPSTPKEEKETESSKPSTILMRKSLVDQPPDVSTAESTKRPSSAKKRTVAKPSKVTTRFKVDDLEAASSTNESKIDPASSKVNLTLQRLRNDPIIQRKVNKSLIRALRTLKTEYDLIDKTSKNIPMKIKNIDDTTEQNKLIAPNRTEIKPGIVNLELVEKNNIKLKLDTLSIHKNFSARRNTIRDKMNEIIQKHTLAMSALNSTHIKTKAEIKMPYETIVTNVPAKISQRKIQEAVSTKSSKGSKLSSRVSTTSSRRSNFSANVPVALREIVNKMNETVDNAIQKHKIFTVCGNYYSIRNALLARGWIEKLHSSHTVRGDPTMMKRLNYLNLSELVSGMRDKEDGHIYRKVIYSKMIGNHPVDLYWDLNRETFRRKNESFKNALINFISKNRFNFANKQGLCESSKQAYWFHTPGVSNLRTPRSYTLQANRDSEDFVADFRISAAMALLKWAVNAYETKTSKVISPAGKVPISNFHFALTECTKFTQKLKHEDIDKNIEPASEKQWNDFLDYFYKTVHVGNHFRQATMESELSIVHKAKTILKKISNIYPYVEMDGYMNIWLLKPSFGSRGIGIHFCRTLQYPLKVINEHKNNSYVVQKYIERPLLIHNTKFDIRQWLLISSTEPLTIWIYKECYLRFSSQTYNLRKLHESVHLTNNSVQSKYHNGNRDPCLPVHNMWYLREFRQHLNNMGYPKVFEEIIYPGMKECIVGVILANQDNINRSRRGFELHGADFMITEDFKPWLIEINSRPALNPSTPVTSKLCPMVLEDVVKVVIDRARNPSASTGHFELIYKETNCGYEKIDKSLRVDGKPISPDYFLTKEQQEEIENKIEPVVQSSGSLNITKTSDYMSHITREIKGTLRQLLTLIEKEKTRRINQRNNVVTDGEHDAFKYIKDMEVIKTEMSEIEEIFKQGEFTSNSSENILGKKINLVHTSDNLLQSNSAKIKTAIDIIDVDKEHKLNNSTVSSIKKIISGLKFSAHQKNKEVNMSKVS